MVILSFFLYFEPFLWSSMWGSMYCNMLKTHHDGCQRSVIVIFFYYWAFHTLFQLPYRLSQCFTVRQYFTLLENMVWIFDAIEYSIYLLRSGFEHFNFECRAALTLPQQPPKEAQSADFNPPSDRGCEARQPQTIPCSPECRITRLRHQSRQIFMLIVKM